jgi:hypothetical protein
VSLSRYDLQAQDRAFRIGQRKFVSIYRLITAGTIEEVPSPPLPPLERGFSRVQRGRFSKTSPVGLNFPYMKRLVLVARLSSRAARG